MDGVGVLPTPRNFELWYTHLSGTHPDLTRRLSALLEGGATPADATLDALHAACLAPRADVDAFEDGAEALQQAA